MFARRTILTLALTFATTILLCGAAIGKVPSEFRGVKLGMPKSQVLDILEGSADHTSFHQIGEQIGEVVRGDKLFRFATYRFDANDVLVEISLHMREIVGRDKVLELFNQEHGLNVGPKSNAVEGDHLVKVQGNRLLLQHSSELKSRSAQAAR